jgi:hypothetical protein
MARGLAMSKVAGTWVKGEQFVASGGGGYGIVPAAPGGRAIWQGFRPSAALAGGAHGLHCG